MLQRLALLEALHAGCPLLLLDEPFSGLDDEGRAWLAGQLAERLDAGAAVLLTDHSGAAAGRVALDGRLQLRDGTAAPAPARGPARRPAMADGGLMVRARHPDGHRVECTVAEAETDDLLRALLRDGWHVEEVRR